MIDRRSFLKMIGVGLLTPFISKFSNMVGKSTNDIKVERSVKYINCGSNKTIPELEIGKSYQVVYRWDKNTGLSNLQIDDVTVNASFEDVFGWDIHNNVDTDQGTAIAYPPFGPDALIKEVVAISPYCYKWKPVKNDRRK